MSLLEKCEQKNPDDPEYIFWCPGCKTNHWFKTTGEKPKPIWTWNGDLEKPTVNPSILVLSGDKNGRTCCHFFIKNGMIEFISDCTHALAGQTVPMEDLDDESRRQNNY